MLQRIQTLYMTLSVLVTSALPFVFELWTLKTDNQATAVFITTSALYLSLFGLVTLLTIISIFSFKKRQNQFVLNRLTMIFNFILLGFFVYRSLNLPGETMVSEKGIGMFLPAISIVLLVLANKAIKKDEDLVKSVDRLR
jgi:cytochrome c biogenesis factor